MKAITLKRFKDLKEGKTREEGEVFTLSKSRFEEIMAVRDDLIESYEKEENPGRQ